MTVPPNHAVLDYATPAVRRRWRLRSWMAVVAAAVLGGMALVLRENIGSGRFIYNPLRELASISAIACLVVYVCLRTTGDAKGWRTRTWIFGGVALAASVAIYVAYYSYNAVRYEPHFSIRNPYFQFVLALFGVAALVSVAKRLRRAAAG